MGLRDRPGQSHRTLLKHAEPVQTVTKARIAAPHFWSLSQIEPLAQPRSAFSPNLDPGSGLNSPARPVLATCPVTGFWQEGLSDRRQTSEATDSSGPPGHDVGIGHYH